VPDARRGAVPLLEPVLLGYVALMLGTAAAALLALYNAVALRRWGLALVALAIGAVGWAGFGGVALVMASAGVEEPALLLLAARVLSVGFGVLLAWSQWEAARGHGFLDGKAVPLLPSILAGFALTLMLPWRTQLLLQGLWPLLFPHG
jgi:hypothetical protein